jgi:hypothetical protein
MITLQPRFRSSGAVVIHPEERFCAIDICFANPEEATMSRYFFHLIGDIQLRDVEGEEHASVEDAVAHARRVARELASNDFSSEYAKSSIVVADSQGREIYEARVDGSY